MLIALQSACKCSVRAVSEEKQPWMLSVPANVKARAQAQAASVGLTCSAYVTRLVTRSRVPEPAITLQLLPLVQLGHRVVDALGNGQLSDADRAELVALRRALADAIDTAATPVLKNGRRG